MPGSTPAINKSATDTLPATTAYTIITLLGGIKSPVVAAVEVSATLKALSYPCRFIWGIINPPTDDTAAAADPEIDPNIMQVSTLTYPSPPRHQPTAADAKSISRRAIPPSPIKYPDRIKNGIASSGKLSTPPAIRWATIYDDSTLPMASTVRNDAAPMQIAIGTFISSSAAKLITRIRISSIIVRPPLACSCYSAGQEYAPSQTAP